MYERKISPTVCVMYPPSSLFCPLDYLWYRPFRTQGLRLGSSCSIIHGTWHLHISVQRRSSTPRAHQMQSSWQEAAPCWGCWRAEGMRRASWWLSRRRAAACCSAASYSSTAQSFCPACWHSLATMASTRARSLCCGSSLSSAPARSFLLVPACSDPTIDNNRISFDKEKSMQGAAYIMHAGRRQL